MSDNISGIVLPRHRQGLAKPLFAIVELALTEEHHAKDAEGPF